MRQYKKIIFLVMELFIFGACFIFGNGGICSATQGAIGTGLPSGAQPPVSAFEETINKWDQDAQNNIQALGEAAVDNIEKHKFEADPKKAAEQTSDLADKVYELLTGDKNKKYNNNKEDFLGSQSENSQEVITLNKQGTGGGSEKITAEGIDRLLNEQPTQLLDVKESDVNPFPGSDNLPLPIAIVDSNTPESFNPVFLKIDRTDQEAAQPHLLMLLKDLLFRFIKGSPQERVGSIDLDMTLSYDSLEATMSQIPLVDWVVDQETGNVFMVLSSIEFTAEIQSIDRLLHPPGRLHPWLKWLLYLNRVTPEMIQYYQAALQQRDRIFQLASKSNGKLKVRYQGKIMDVPVYVWPDQAEGAYELVMVKSHMIPTATATRVAGGPLGISAHL
jgi:hypothetical protein